MYDLVKILRTILVIFNYINCFNIIEKVKSKIYFSNMKTNQLDFLNSIDKGDREISDDVDMLLDIFSDVYPLEVHIQEDLIFIGRCPTEMKDDETMGNWKSEVRDDLEKSGLLGIKECGWHHECWFDG